MLVACLLVETGASAQTVTLTHDELEEIPGIVGGPLSVVPFLPGAAPLLSPVALSSVRGKQPSTLGVFYDDVELPTAFHLLAGPSVLQDAAVGSLRWSRSAPLIERRGYPSGTLELSPPEMTAGLHADAAIDLLRAGAIGDWATSDGSTRVTAGASLAWTPWLFTRLVSGSGPQWDPSRAALRADLGDYLVRAQHDFAGTDVRVLALGSLDAASMASDTDLLGASLDFHRVDLRATRELAGGLASAGVLVGYDRLGAELGGSVVQSRALVIQRQAGARLAWERALGTIGALRVGGDVSRRSADLVQLWDVRMPGIEGGSPSEELRTGERVRIADAVISGAWAEAELGLGTPWRVIAGLRADDYHLFPGKDLVAVDPRLSAAWAFSDSLEAHASAALLHAPPGFLLPLPGVDLAALRFGLREMVRVDAGVTLRPWTRTSFSLDAYVDPSLRALELSPLDRDFLQTVKGSADEVIDAKATHGEAHGVELFVRRELEGGWFAFGSLSWQQSQRVQRFPRRNDYGEPVEEVRATLPVTWDHSVLASATGGRSFGAWTVSAAAQFHTGAPELGGISSTTQREGLDRLEPGPRWIEADLDQAGRLPPYFRLDVRVARAFQAGPVQLLASLDLQNLTLSNEVVKFNYGYENGELVRKPGGIGVPALPLPMLGLSARY